jgi:hypothetical protein
MCEGMPIGLAMKQTLWNFFVSYLIIQGFQLGRAGTTAILTTATVVLQQ